MRHYWLLHSTTWADLGACRRLFQTLFKSCGCKKGEMACKDFKWRMRVDSPCKLAFWSCIRNSGSSHALECILKGITKISTYEVFRELQRTCSVNYSVNYLVIIAPCNMRFLTQHQGLQTRGVELDCQRPTSGRGQSKWGHKKQQCRGQAYFPWASNRSDQSVSTSRSGNVSMWTHCDIVTHLLHSRTSCSAQ